MNFSYRFAGIAIQVFRLVGGSRLLFELFVSLIGGGLVLERVRFFFIDGFFFNRSGGGKRRGLLFAVGRCRPLVLLGLSQHAIAGLVSLFGLGLFSLDLFGDLLTLLMRVRYRSPSGHGGGIVFFLVLVLAKLAIPGGRGGSGFDWLFRSLSIVVLLVQRFRERCRRGKDWLIFREGCGQRRRRLGTRFRA